ncbi:hypothetical protein LUZ60_011170 [Juncus effusus]|nr:hypothetical protein LUZ60_011170 [Juncus effusus]
MASQTTKWDCLDCILKLNHGKDLQEYLSAIRQIEQNSRWFYLDEIHMDKGKFCQILLLDGCFMLVTVRALDEMLDVVESPRDTSPSNGESEEATHWYSSSVLRDLLLLENQIPFFVLNQIYDLIDGDHHQNSTRVLIDKLFQFIEGFLDKYPKSINASNRPRDAHHLLDLCHMYFRQSRVARMDCNGSTNTVCRKCWRKAEEYYEAGIVFTKKVHDGKSNHSLLDINFTRPGRLEIPSLVIDDYTVSIFRNLIAFEQTTPQAGNDITTYIIFLSGLIKITQRRQTACSKRCSCAPFTP